MKVFQKLLDTELKKLNSGSRIKLRKHKAKRSTNWSFYLEFYSEGKRQKLYIKGYSLGFDENPADSFAFQTVKNVQILKNAEYTRNPHQFSLNENIEYSESTETETKRELNLYEQMEEYFKLNKPNPETRKSYIQNKSKFKEYLGPNPPPLRAINRDVLLGFKNYLLERYSNQDTARKVLMYVASYF